MGQCLHTPTSIDVAVCTSGVFGEYMHVHMLYRCMNKTINYIICVYIIILMCIMFMISVFEGL